MDAEARLQEDELAVSLDEIIDDLGVAVAGHQAFAHQQAQVAGGSIGRVVSAVPVMRPASASAITGLRRSFPTRASMFDMWLMCGLQDDGR